MVGVFDLVEGAVRDNLLHPTGVLRRKDEAFIVSGKADGREQYEGWAPDAGPQLGEGVAAHLLPVVANDFEVGVVAPLATLGPYISCEVSLEVYVPAALEDGEAL